MTLPRNRFKAWLKEPPARPPLGSWLMAASPVTAEAMGWAGFDFLVLDMEHVPVDIPQALALMQAVAGTPAEIVVRLPWNDPVIVKRVLDAGAQSLMFPFVQNAAEAAAAVAATRYPPEGIRGVAAMHRAARYGMVGDYLHKAQEEIAVILQLETSAAVAALPRIAEVAGVDAVFTGPADLSASMGRLGGIGEPDVQQALRDALGEAHRLGLPCGIVGGTPDLVRAYLDAGFDYVALGSDLALMMGAARGALSALRGDDRPAAATGAY